MNPDETTFADQLLDTIARQAAALATIAHDTATCLAATAPITAAQHLPPLIAAFDRMATAVRRTIALRHRIAADRARLAAGLDARTTARAAARRALIRRMEDVIDSRPRPAAETEYLLRDLHERLDDPALDEDLLARKVTDIAAEIARDLGIGSTLPPHHKRRAAADLPVLHARAAAPCRPAPAPLREPPSG